MAQLTQHQKIVAIMCINKTKTWWKSYDLLNATDGNNDLFIGYEVTARFSELASTYPDMFENKREGKYIIRRMRFETGRDWWHNLPKDMQQLISKYYKREQVNT